MQSQYNLNKIKRIWSAVGWKFVAFEKERSLYQKGKDSLSLLSREMGDVVPCPTTWNRRSSRSSTCARAFLRTRVTYISQEERSESRVAQKARVFSRFVAREHHISRDIPFVDIISDYAIIIELRGDSHASDLPQIRRFSAFCPRQLIANSVADLVVFFVPTYWNV